MKPHISVVYLDEVPAESIEQFAADLGGEGLTVGNFARPNPGPYAGMQWLIPTAIAVYLTRSYFDGFLKEAGKDHYLILKTALNKLTAKHIGPTIAKGVRFFTKGKVFSGEPEYSMHYSLVGELGQGFTAKLLLEPELSSDESAKAIAAFLDFLNAFHEGTLQVESVIGLEDAPSSGKVLLIHFNQEIEQLEVIDPIPKHVRDAQCLRKANIDESENKAS